MKVDEPVGLLERLNFHAIDGPNGMCLCGVKADGTVVTCGALLEAYVQERIAAALPPLGPGVATRQREGEKLNDPTCEWGADTLCGQAATYICYPRKFPSHLYACDRHAPLMVEAADAHRLSSAPPLSMEALKAYMTALAWQAVLLRDSDQLRAAPDHQGSEDPRTYGETLLETKAHRPRRDDAAASPESK